MIFTLILAVMVYVFLNRSRREQKAIPIKKSKQESNESEILRSLLSPDKIIEKPNDSTRTLYDVLKQVKRLMPNKKQWGARRIVRVVEEEKEVMKVIGGETKKEIKKWSFFELSGYEWMTYQEIYEQTHQIGAGLVHLGLKAGDFLTIFAPTSREWSMMAFSCITQNITITTAYDSLGADGLTFALNEGQVTTVFTAAELVPVLMKVASDVPFLKNVIYYGDDKTLDTSASSLQIMSLEAVRQLGIKHPADPNPPKESDTVCIMYTSGSTGNPKGVQIKHSNLIAGIAAGKSIIVDHFNEDDVFLAFLPLAHILEMLIECILFYFGVSIGYGTVRTLTDASVRNCKGDIRELRPTFMAAVPAVWETIRKGVMTKLKQAPPTKQKIFHTIFNLKLKLMKLGLPSGFLDFAFKLIKDGTGGRLRFAISGGAPLPRETHQFMSVTICPILQGYGMTETCGLISVQHPDEGELCILGEVGSPSPSIEIKLVDVPEMGYLSSNKPRSQGELWVRGPSVTTGYYKQPKITSETITEDGWLMTGDICEFTPEGTIKVFDRKKNLVKLSHGEYIAIEKLESLYRTASHVQNVCVVADPEHSRAVALVAPIFPDLTKYVQAEGLDSGKGHLENEDIVKIPQVRQLLFDAILAVAKLNKLKAAEIFADIYVVPDEWNPQNNLLTPAMKLNRKGITKKYEAQVKTMLSKIP